MAPRALADWQPSPRYPDPAVKVLDPGFAKYKVNLAKVERLATGFRWCEGPGWFGDGRYLLWSDLPNDRIMRWDEETVAVRVFRKPSHNANGNTRDRVGQLVTRARQRRVTHGVRRLDQRRRRALPGQALNSPNDVVAVDSSIWFTTRSDPLLRGHKAAAGCPRTCTASIRMGA